MIQLSRAVRRTRLTRFIANLTTRWTLSNPHPQRGTWAYTFGVLDELRDEKVARTIYKKVTFSPSGVYTRPVWIVSAV